MTNARSTTDITTPAASQPVATVENLRVETATGRCIVDGVSLQLCHGEILGVVGESGSGKTTSALAFFGFVQHGARFTGGTVRLPDHAPIDLPSATNMRDLRGRYFSYVPQNPGTALNPSMRVATLLGEVAARRAAVDATFARERDTVTTDVLGIVGLPTSKDFRARYPHQLSGGQQQRVCIAMALLSGSRAIVLDEPTTGLDVITQSAIIEELQRLRRESNVTMLYISHDLAVVSQLATKVAVMYDGKVVEVGETHSVLNSPSHPYTRKLLDASPDLNRPGDESPFGTVTTSSDIVEPQQILQVCDLNITHRVRGVEAHSVRDINFGLRHGECLALVGQSGSGKTTIARAVAGIQSVDSGEISLNGTRLPAMATERSVDQRRRLQIVFQNPTAALNPRETIRTAIDRARRQVAKSDEISVPSTTDLLDMVRLPHATAEHLPKDLSGGERQRVCIARALAARPEVMICDEITSALDVSVQASVLTLINELRRELNLALLFITHDLGVVAGIADMVMILENGRVREFGKTADVLGAPSSAYGRSLIDAVPSLAAATA
jgi:peptide/nickel transport system ATP-binding protein